LFLAQLHAFFTCGGLANEDNQSVRHDAPMRRDSRFGISHDGPGAKKEQRLSLVLQDEALLLRKQALL
jgi:hypothetical protein